MTGLQETQETRATILLRCEELQSYLGTTKERLNQAASQLEELTKILLVRQPESPELLSRPWLEELVIGQLIDDVRDAESKLADVRSSAAELGIQLPIGQK
ncbi:MAG TPA: hypothetical protein VHZ28_18780 [Terracidiphilus sp.]|jgi:hypothetical protein|nr:hypothetical protein [Terracidiphilus sp.]